MKELNLVKYFLNIFVVEVFRQYVQSQLRYGVFMFATTNIQRFLNAKIAVKILLIDWSWLARDVNNIFWSLKAYFE